MEYKCYVPGKKADDDVNDLEILYERTIWVLSEILQVTISYF